jgi:hypothetical protein
VAQRSNLASSSAKYIPDNDLIGSLTKEMSFTYAVTQVHEAHDPKREVNYKASTEAYKNYWATVTYTDAYVFDIEERKKLSIQQLNPAPADVNIQNFEKLLASDMFHYLVHTAYKSMKQLLCVMSMNKTRKPERGYWDRIQNGEFYIVNGQHSMSASKLMVKIDLDESIINFFPNGTATLFGLTTTKC